jgi:hypothetical protein
MKDIMVLSSIHGPYGVILDLAPSTSTPDITDGSVDTLNGQIVQLSISHENDYAVATAIVPTETSSITNG